MLCAWLGWACTGLGNCMLQCCGQALGSALARPWEWLFGRPWGGVVESLGHGSGLLGQGTAMQLAWLCKGLARALGMPWAVLWTGLGHDPGKALGMALGRPWAMLWKDWGQSLGIDLKGAGLWDLGGRALESLVARLGAGLGQGSWDALGQCFGHALGSALAKPLAGPWMAWGRAWGWPGQCSGKFGAGRCKAFWQGLARAWPRFLGEGAVLWTGLGHDPGKALGMALGRPWAMLWKAWGQGLGIDLKGGRALGSWWQGLGKPVARLGAGLGQGTGDALGQCFGHAFWHGTGQALDKALEGLELGLGDGLGQAFGKALECIDGGLGHACPCGVMPQGHD